MPCSITIESVAIVDPQSTPPTALHIKGTASDCSEVNVWVVCNASCLPEDAAVVATDTAGRWALDLPIAINSACTCGTSVTVYAECVSDLTCNTKGEWTLECPQECPIVTASATPSDSCNDLGTRTVTFSVTMTDTSGSFPLAQWTDGTNIWGTIWVVYANSTVTGTSTRDFGPGTHTVVLQILNPVGCPGVEVEFTVDECPPYCPDQEDVRVEVGDCDDEGNREVTLSFQQPLTADVDWGDGEATGVTDAMGVSHHYPASGPYTARISVDGCPELEVVVGPFDPCLPGAPTGACCLPTGLCTDMTEAQCISVGGTYQGDGTACATTVCVTGPPGGGNNGGDNGDNGGAGPCGYFAPLIAALLGVAISLGLVLGTMNCMGLPIPPVVWGVVIGIGAAPVIALGLWYLLCQLGICVCPTTCDLLAIVWSSFLGGAIVAAYLSGCCPVMGVFVIGFGAIALFTFLAWFNQCYNTCTMLGFLLLAVVSGAGTALAVLAFIPLIVQCGYSAVGLVAALAGALLGVLTFTCNQASAP